MTQENSNKVYYSIGELADILGESVSCVRVWSNELESVIKPRRNKKGNRYFTPKDVEKMKAARYLIRECGLTIRGARAKLESDKLVTRVAATDTPEADADAQPDLVMRAEVATRLTSIRARLVEISKYL